MVDRCKTCKYWPPLKEETYGSLFRYCKHPKCDQMGSEAELDRLIPEDANGYQSFIKTGPDFGCIHHEFADQQR